MCCVLHLEVCSRVHDAISVVDYSGMLILKQMKKNVALPNDKHWQPVTHIRCQQACQRRAWRLYNKSFASAERML